MDSSLLLKIVEELGGPLEYVNPYGRTKVLCPFHHDRTKSASIDMDKLIFKCFACSVQGDALNIIMIVEEVDYASSKRRFKEITGVDYSEVSGSTEGQSGGGIPLRTRDYERHSSLFPSWFRTRSSG